MAIQALAAPVPAICGGSDQIQRNVIGERVLGLPKEPGVSRDVPFRDLKKGMQGQEARSLWQLLYLPMSSRTCVTWYGGSWRRNRRSARYGG